MMTRNVFSRSVLCRIAAAAVVVASLAIGGPAASAATIGTVTVEPATGNDLTVFTLITSRNCPAGGNVYASISGKGFASGGKVIVGNSPTAIYPRTSTGGIALPIADALRTFVDQELNPVPLAGAYQVSVSCRDGAKAADLGEFIGTITFATPHAYVATEPNLPAADLALLPPLGTPASPVAKPKPGPLARQAAPAKAATAPVAAAPATKSASTLGPWLFGVGGLAFLGGIALMLRSRRNTVVAA